MRLGLFGGEPHRTTPHACCAERHRCGHLASATDAASTEHWNRGNCIDDLGNKHHRANLTGVPTGFGTLGDDDVDTNVYVTLRMLRLTSQRADETAFFFDSLDHVRRRRPECVDNQ